MKKFLTNIEEYSKWIILVIGTLFIASLLILRTKAEHDKKIEEYLNSERAVLSSEVEATRKTYEIFSSYIYEQVVNTEENLILLQKAYYSDVENKDKLRSELLGRLEDRYSLIREYNFRQLHFHSPQGDSFLRVHKPEKYGDNLLDIRKSVKYANENRVMTSGFEEGRIFSGYRYVYPLNYGSDFLGTAEVSVSIATFVDMLYDLYRDKNFYFLIKEETVNSAVFEGEAGNYIESTILEGYLEDREIVEKFEEFENVVDIDRKDAFCHRLRDSICSCGNLGEDFSFFMEFEEQLYTVHFVSVADINEESVGYVVSVYKDEKLLAIQNQLKREYAYILLMIVLFGVTVYTLIKEQYKLKNTALKDNLTKIYNRHYFIDRAERELSRRDRYGTTFSIIMLDIDHFKAVNDTYGHSCGDDVLKKMSREIDASLRSADVFARWGGEEFIVLLSQTDIEGAQATAEKLRSLVEEMRFKEVGSITISLGVSEQRQADKSINSIIDRADSGLYKAKESGRNRVCRK